MEVEIVGVIDDDGSMVPVMTDEEERRLFEDMPWLTEEDFGEPLPANQLVIEVKL